MAESEHVTAPQPSTRSHVASPTDTDRYARKAILASASGYAMDGFDLLILSFSMAAIASDFGISKTAAGSLTTATLWGAVLGGIIFGVLADKLGRVRMLTWSILVFAVFTGLCAAAQDFTLLTVLRFMAGVGLGGEFGIGMALAAEAWPNRLRARATALVGLGWQFGVLMAALCSPFIIEHWGWRGLFALGVLPALGAFFIRRGVGEPSRFEQRKERPIASWQEQLRGLGRDRTTLKATLGILVLCSVQNFGYYGIMTWLPTYLATDFGYSLTRSGLWTSVTVLGMACGIFCFGQVADRLGRRPAFWAYQLGAAVSVLAYSRLTSSMGLLIGGAVMGFFVNGMLGGLGALMAEAYPTDIRATAENVLFNIGRAVGGLAPMTIAFISAEHGFSLAIALLAALYVLDAAVMPLIPERRGAQLA
ncbi:MFS transporter [Streptomyces chartreusis]|uniref:MFS transporter n=1 Tax=Streptomyces chartreusis TaxID=1969 RepID=UPI0033A855C4